MFTLVKHVIQGFRDYKIYSGALNVKLLINAKRATTTTHHPHPTLPHHPTPITPIPPTPPLHIL